MHTLVVGINHKTAGVDMRGKFYIADNKINLLYKTLRSYDSIYGAVIITTCNRFEIYASVKNVEKGAEAIIDFMASQFKISNDTITLHSYIKNCHQAVMHLFEVISGIDSMVFGEYQIQGQVRDAYVFAKSIKSTDSYLNKLFETAISAGKRVRSETEIGKGKLSVVTLAIELIKQLHQNTRGLNVLIVGSGRMAELMAVKLQHLSCNIKITNRSMDKANKLANQFNSTAVEYENRYNSIKNCDIIIVATRSETYVLEAENIKDVVMENPCSSKLFIDLSVPRNIAPAIKNFNNCIVYSIDDINSKINLNIDNRSACIKDAENILNEIAEKYYNWYYKQVVLPVMHKIKIKLDVLKDVTIASFKPHCSFMSDDEQKIVREILDSYSEKLIKVIMKNMTNVTSKEDIVSIVEKLRVTFNTDTEIIDETEEIQNHYLH